ncbi:exodeoxyribonuclease VII large subunit [candidate division KSB1 bacterium]|nr:exodeoxyribonuclease VII large subunit [candidate division KSB1 bacterium]
MSEASKARVEREAVYSVGQITREIKKLFANSFGAVWIEGEVSGFKRHSSGHAYFTLKDATAQLSCAMWKGSLQRVQFEPRDGMKVRAFGNLDLYEPRGSYQLIVSLLQQAGEGELQRAFELLKARLQAEGLFDSARKRPLPRFPDLVGIVTSPTGAVIHDMQTVAARRWPAAQLVLRPVRVQGEGAAGQIAQAIAEFNRTTRVDLLIVARGGGSLEDLWAFNEEAVARAIFESMIPVVSAIGHEVDFTIADFVADLRAPTPSAAMELILPDREQVAGDVHALGQRLARALGDQQRHLRTQLEAMAQHWALRRPMNLVILAGQRIDDLDLRLQAAYDHGLRLKSGELNRLTELLQSYRPQSVLDRGYAIVRDESGAIARDARLLRHGDRLAVTFAQGVAKVSVESAA